MYTDTNIDKRTFMQGLRICHIVEATAGGSARIAAQLIEDQIERGASLTLIYSAIRADQWFMDTINRLPKLTLIKLNMQREVGIRDIVPFFKLLSIFTRNKKFDIIHSHSSKAGALARLVGLFIRHPKQIYSPHAFYTMSNVKSPIYGWIERSLSYLSDAIILVSPLEYRHAHEKLHIAESKLHIVLNGIDTKQKGNRKEARKWLGAPETQFAIGFVGRLEEAKNPARLITSFERVVQQKDNAFLYIVGEGTLKKHTQDLVAQKQLEDKVRFISSNDARDIIAGFDCLVCSSDYESFCLVIIEALAENVPVVTTPVGISEIAIVPEKNGYIVGFEPASIADKVVRVANTNYDQRLSYIKETYAIVRKFDIHAMLQQTFDLYLSLLKKE